jgi:hypothetical protein
LLNFEIFEYKRIAELCYEIELKNFKLFYHFIIEPHSVVAEYFENSEYFHIYDVNFKVKSKNPDRIGSKRTLEEDEDKTLKSINNLGKKMKKMKAQFHPSEVDRDEDINLKIIAATENSPKNLEIIDKNDVFNIEDTFKVRKFNNFKNFAKTRSKSSDKPVKATNQKTNKSINWNTSNEILLNQDIVQTAPKLAIGARRVTNEMFIETATISRKSTKKEKTKKQKKENLKKKGKQTKFILET